MKKLQYYLRKEKKYLVWIGGICNVFDNSLDAEIEKMKWKEKGYTDIQIKTIN